MKTLKRVILTNLDAIFLIGSFWIFPLIGLLAYLLTKDMRICGAISFISFIHFICAMTRIYQGLEELSSYFKRTITNEEYKSNSQKRNA